MGFVLWLWTRPEETVIDLAILGAVGCRRRDEEIRATQQRHAESTRLTKRENKGKINFCEQGFWQQDRE